MSVYRFEIREGSRGPSIAGLVALEAGATLVGATATFSMKDHITGIVKIDEEDAVVDASAGTVTYTWQDGDTDTPGTYEAEFKILLGGTTPLIQPAGDDLFVVVRPSISP